MKSKLIVGIVLVALLALVLAAPVLAAPTNGNKVDASIVTVSKVSSTSGTMMITDGQSVKITDATAVYNNMLTIDGVPYAVYSVNMWDGTLNLETFTMVQHYKAAWFIPAKDSNSGFAGNVHITL